jgi:uncharacterized protein
MSNRRGEPNLIAADLILLLLAAPGATQPRNHLNGITRLEKLLFLADRETDVPRMIESPFPFTPYHYGPYSREVYEAVDLLEEADLISEERVFEGQALDEMEELEAVQTQSEGVERRFSLTANGQAVANLLADRNRPAFEALTEIKSRYGGMPLRQLIRYVYSRYPDFASVSRIRDQVT